MDAQLLSVPRRKKTCCSNINMRCPFNHGKGDLAIRRIFSLVDMITKPKFSNCPNIFKLELFLK